MGWTDPGATGMALLAFLEAGNTHRTGPYRDVVQKAIRYLKGTQSPDGCFGPREGHYMYNHAIAALAMVRAYELSGASPLIRGHAQKGIDFLAHAQNPGLGWRYSVRCGDNDTSVTTWCLWALHVGHEARLKVPAECFSGGLAWIDKVTDRTYWKVGYRTAGDPGARLTEAAGRFEPQEAMTAAGMLCRLLDRSAGQQHRDALQGGAALLLDTLPRWDDAGGTIDLYYWHLATQALQRLGGEPWEQWRQAQAQALREHQRTDGGAAGSWDPVGAWGSAGGRLYSTCTAILTLQAIDATEER
jgi:hypothetical protein